MSSESGKQLAEIKGYIARLYALVRSRTEMAISLSEEQEESTSGFVDTIEDINTKLQIANSFQQDEIFNKLSELTNILSDFKQGESYNKLVSIEKLLKQLLEVYGEPTGEEFVKVEKWKAFKFSTLPLVGDIIAWFAEESDKNYNIKTPYVVQPYRGPQWVTRGFEMFSLMSVKDTTITISRNLVVGPWDIPEKLQQEFFNSAAYRSGYTLVNEPWRKAVPTDAPAPELHKPE